MIVMHFFGIELERVSIASSIIALGMLVDNGIVIAEEIRSRLERGEDRRQACIETGSTLSIPLLTSSLTTILAFLPMLLLDGQTGEYAFSLPMVVIILLLSSWFLSMYVTPAMCFWFMKVKPTATAADPGTHRATRRRRQRPLLRRLLPRLSGLLEGLLRVRVIVTVACAVAHHPRCLDRHPAGAGVFRSQHRSQPVPGLRGSPAGYRIDSTDETVQRLNAWLSDKAINPEVTSTVAYVGSGGPRFFLVLSPVQPNPHVAFLVVNTETADQVPKVMQRLRKQFLSALPEAAGRVKQMWMGSAEPGFVEIRLIGPDPEYLYEKGNQLVDGLRAMPGTLDVRSNWENKILKARIVVDQVRARRAGVTSRDVALWLQAHMDGLEVTEYREGDIAIPVLARSIEEHRSGFGDLWNVKVTSSRTGDLVPLTQIADIEVESDFYRISRRNQERCLTVELKHETLRAPELLAETLPLVEALELAPDYRWEVGGESEQSAETMGQLMQWMPICVFGIAVLLIWQFNSFRRPLIIFITIPLAFTGGFIGLIDHAARPSISSLCWAC